MTERVAAFWSLFVERADELAQVESADTPVYDALLEQLQTIHPNLYLEFCALSGGGELIITAEGEAALFPLAREVVDAAPACEGWEVIALKPQLGFPKTVSWEGFTVSIDDVVFESLERVGTDDLGLRIFVAGLNPAKSDDAHNALLRAIDHGLGEERHANEIQDRLRAQPA